MLSLDGQPGAGDPSLAASAQLDAPVSKEERVLSFRIKRSAHGPSAASKELARAGVGIDVDNENSISDTSSSAGGIADPDFFRNPSGGGYASKAQNRGQAQHGVDAHASLKQAHENALAAVRQKAQARRDARTSGTLGSNGPSTHSKNLAPSTSAAAVTVRQRPGSGGKSSTASGSTMGHQARVSPQLSSKAAGSTALSSAAIGVGSAGIWVTGRDLRGVHPADMQWVCYISMFVLSSRRYRS